VSEHVEPMVQGVPGAERGDFAGRCRRRPDGLTALLVCVTIL